MEKEPNNQQPTEDFHQYGLHKVSIFQWVIIIVLGLAILTAFYVGCGSNRVGVTMNLPPSGTSVSTSHK